MSPSPTLYNLSKLCKQFRFIECKRNECDCKEGGSGGRFQRRKVRLVKLARVESTREVCGSVRAGGKNANSV